jgi:RNA polymerase sigma factor (sigma-70 family)
MTGSADLDRRLAHLMLAAQEGDSASYALLLSEAAGLVRGMIRRRLRAVRAEDIEDILQDVLLSIHAARATYDPARPFLPWLAAITRNRIADGARRHARRSAFETTCDPLPETSAHSDANMPKESYGDGQALARAMADLPPGQRQAIELVKLRELSLKEAAAASGMSVGAVKVAVHRGITALRKALGAKG